MFRDSADSVTTKDECSTLPAYQVRVQNDCMTHNKKQIVPRVL